MKFEIIKWGLFLTATAGCAALAVWRLSRMDGAGASVGFGMIALLVLLLWCIERRPTITLPHAIAAALWLTASIGAPLIVRLEGPNEHWLMPFAPLLLFLLFGGPFAAAGTLVGKPWHGFLAGFAATVAAFMLMTYLPPLEPPPAVWYFEGFSFPSFFRTVPWPPGP